MKKIRKELHISTTAFTTITINKNFQTRIHTDKGDFQEGMSCMAVVGKDYEGGAIAFPRLNIKVNIRPGDIIFMDAHEPHCTTRIIKKNKNAVRYSLVCYVRTNLQKFHRKIVERDGKIYFI